MNISEIPILDSKWTHDLQIYNLGFCNVVKNNSLCFCEADKYVEEIDNNPNVVCVITKRDLASAFKQKKSIVIADHPRKLFYETHAYLVEKTDFYKPSISYYISKSSKIYPNTYIADKNVHIGDNVIIEPNVTILENVVIEENVIIGAGSVIGSEGFQYVRIDERIISVKHAGGVIVKRNSEIGANCCVAKGLFGDNTIIGNDTKLDNLVHISHEVKIGRRCLLAANVLISGSSCIGNDVWIGPGAIISNSISIGDKVKISLGSVVVESVAAGKHVSGNFASDHWHFLRMQAQNKR